MRRDKRGALALRLRGYSYNEIHRELSVAKSTLSSWFANTNLSEQARKRLDKRVADGSMRGLLKKNRQQTDDAWRRANLVRAEASKDVLKLSRRELLLVGVALYWAEGYKKLIVKNGKERTAHTISFTNSDPKMITLFLRFLVDIVEIKKQKISVSMRLFAHIKQEEALAYWSDITGLEKNNFQKPSFVVSKSSLGKRPYTRLPYGTIQIVVGDTKNFHRIMGWIEGMEKSF